MTIKEKVQRIHSMRNRLTLELQTIQENCPHADMQGKYKADTGNWCSSDDSYWIDAECLDCGKRFHIDSKGPGYRQFKGKIIK